MTQWHNGYSGPDDQSAPAGWYPVDGGLQRYWDGSAWTEHTDSLPAAPQPNLPPPPDPPLPQPSMPQPPVAPDAPAPWIDGMPAAPTGTQPASQLGGQAGSPAPLPFAGAGAASPHNRYLADSPPRFSSPVSREDRTLALIIHLIAIATGIFGPLVLWLAKKDESPFIAYHGKEALNFQLSLMLYWMITVVAMFVLIGLVFIPVLLILQLVMPIVAAVAANRGEGYRYPLTLRIIT